MTSEFDQRLRTISQKLHRDEATRLIDQQNAQKKESALQSNLFKFIHKQLLKDPRFRQITTSISHPQLVPALLRLGKLKQFTEIKYADTFYQLGPFRIRKNHSPTSAVAPQSISNNLEHFSSHNYLLPSPGIEDFGDNFQTAALNIFSQLKQLPDTAPNFLSLQLNTDLVQQAYPLLIDAALQYTSPSVILNYGYGYGLATNFSYRVKEVHEIPYYATSHLSGKITHYTKKHLPISPPLPKGLVISYGSNPLTDPSDIFPSHIPQPESIRNSEFHHIDQFLNHLAALIVNNTPPINIFPPSTDYNY